MFWKVKLHKALSGFNWEHQNYLAKDSCYGLCFIEKCAETCIKSVPFSKLEAGLM